MSFAKDAKAAPTSFSRQNKGVSATESFVRHLLLVIGILLFGPVLAQEPSLRFGITDTFSTPMACAIFSDAELQPGQPLIFIGFDPQRWISGRIVQRRVNVCREESILKGIAYDVQLDEPEGQIGGLGLSIIGSDLIFAGEAEQLVFIRASDGETFTFRRCASSEGLHFFAYQDQVELWHEYYYVPYDTERTCLDSDFETGPR